MISSCFDFDNIFDTTKPIFLIGFMGCGKTFYGKQIAHKTKKDFIDIDEYISRKHQKTIKEIFENEGEKHFRLLEKEALHEVIELKNIVVATGGGTPCFYDNMDKMNEKGITIYIETNQQILFENLHKSKDSRPLLANKNKKELLEYINKELNLREKYYKMAKYKRIYS